MSWIPIIFFLADLMIRIGLSVRVILRRRPVGVSLAWLFVILLLPFVGAFLYLLIGEPRLGKRRAATIQALAQPQRIWLEDLRGSFAVDWSDHGPECEPLARLAENATGIPALPGNTLRLISDWEQGLKSIIADIDGAKRTCHMEFYIWHPGGIADEVARALLRASGRGVICRILLDAVGSDAFLKSSMAQRFRDEGIQLESALPGGLFRMLVTRFDLRMHRKIVVIDGAIAYTGSLNMVDPRLFKQKSNIGQWIDAIARLHGPAVEPMAMTFLGDWELERNEGLEKLRETGDVQRQVPTGDSTVQILPSGPTLEDDAIQPLLMTIYAARRELVITTPYFVPDEALLTALISAVRRGVDVTLIVPARVDSLLVRLASQPHMGALLLAGVRVMRFTGGLLHTKSVTVDGQMCLFGSLNLDPRSIYLNFELTLSVYDRRFTHALRALQQSYIAESTPMLLEDWEGRRLPRRFVDNAARLLSPLL